jgi:hypothetical protein
VVHHDPPPPVAVDPAVPAGLSGLIVRLLAKDPTARLLSAAAVADELAALAAGSTAAPVPPTARRFRRGVAVGVGTALIAAAVFVGCLLTPDRASTRSGGPGDPAGETGSDPGPSHSPTAVRYRGQVDVLVERADPGGGVRLLRLNEPGALPLRKEDKFRVEGKVDPPAYLYVVWVDPGHDVTPVYPWNAAVGWCSRPVREEPVGRVSLPPNTGDRYTAPEAKPGVATVVLLARPTPLDVPDEVVRTWFEGLDELPLPAGGEHAAVWFDDYVEVRDPDRLRTFGVVGSADPFARWQGRLQKAVGDRAAFQTAVSFARRGGD